MKKNHIGLLLVILGGLIIFSFSWLAPWWTSPIWSSAPPEQFEGTNWAAFGPIFMIMSFGVPVGIILLTIGLLLYTASNRSSVWLVMLVVVLATLGILYPPTTGYYPIVFGIGGGLILIFFFATPN